jgi:uncharacterized protein (DUF362 family)
MKGAIASATVACVPGPIFSQLPVTPPSPTAYKYPNPGKIVVATHSGAVTGLNKVNESIVQSMLDQCIMESTGITSSPADALASFFPNLTKNTKIAIKPNLINSSVPTRKELVKAVLKRLTEMLGGFPAANIYMYDNQSFSGSGYTTAYFGQAVNLVQDGSFPDLGYYIFCDGKSRPYSKTLHDCDYLINMPVMKDHYCGMNFTLAFKNHMGTVNPGGALGICSNQKAALDITADAVMVAKQKLIIQDGLYAVLDGGPGGAPGATPCMITLSQDPVTSDYYARKTINEYRKSKGYAEKLGSYIEQASVAPYSIGVANPAEMNIKRLDLTTEASKAPIASDWTLSECYPNPFNGTTAFNLELQLPAGIHLAVHDTAGKEIALLFTGEMAQGFHSFEWNGTGHVPGIYYLTLQIHGQSTVRKMVLTH